MSVQGRDLLTGKPKQVSYREIAGVRTNSELKMLLWKLYLKLLQNSRHLQQGNHLPVVVLCCEDWTKEFLKKQTYLFTAEDPLRAVVRGTGMAKPQKFKKYLNKIGTFIIPFISKS
jgi:hypothetical protein